MKGRWVMGYERCKACDHWGWLDLHKCPPAWRVWCPDYGEDHPEQGAVIRALDSESAAVKWAEYQDENYTMIDNPRTVRVIAENDLPQWHDGSEFDEFEVLGEASIDFYAHATERKDGGK